MGCVSCGGRPPPSGRQQRFSVIYLVRVIPLFILRRFIRFCRFEIETLFCTISVPRLMSSVFFGQLRAINRKQGRVSIRFPEFGPTDAGRTDASYRRQIDPRLPMDLLRASSFQIDAQACKSNARCCATLSLVTLLFCGAGGRPAPTRRRI